MYLKVYNHSCHCVCPSAKSDVGHGTEWLQCSWIPLRSIGFKDCMYSNFQHIKTEKLRQKKMGIFKYCIQNS